jgi:hypothetical protein
MTHSCVFVFFCDFFVHPGHRWRSGDHVSTFLTKVHVLFEAVLVKTVLVKYVVSVDMSCFHVTLET